AADSREAEGTPDGSPISNAIESLQGMFKSAAGAVDFRHLRGNDRKQGAGSEAGAASNQGGGSGTGSDQSSGKNSGNDCGAQAPAKEGDQAADWTDDTIPPPPPTRRLWHGIDGIAVMTFGVLSPILMTALSVMSCPKRITLVLLNHPVETLVEIL